MLCLSSAGEHRPAGEKTSGLFDKLGEAKEIKGIGETTAGSDDSHLESCMLKSPMTSTVDPRFWINCMQPSKGCDGRVVVIAKVGSNSKNVYVGLSR